MEDAVLAVPPLLDYNVLKKSKLKYSQKLFILTGVRW